MYATQTPLVAQHHFFNLSLHYFFQRCAIGIEYTVGFFFLVNAINWLKYRWLKYMSTVNTSSLTCIRFLKTVNNHVVHFLLWIVSTDSLYVSCSPD